jgi:hypothetical protein
LVTTYFGDNLADSRVPPADRQAVIAVQDAIRDRGRYSLVYERKHAELVILVRKGRTAETRDGIDIHAGSDRSPSLGRVTDADGGDPQDARRPYCARGEIGARTASQG